MDDYMESDDKTMRSLDNVIIVYRQIRQKIQELYSWWNKVKREHPDGVPQYYIDEYRYAAYALNDEIYDFNYEMKRIDKPGWVLFPEITGAIIDWIHNSYNHERLKPIPTLPYENINTLPV